MRQEIDEIWKLLKKHENKLNTMSVQKILKKVFKYKNSYQRWSNTYLGLHLALCVDTRDPWKQNRIRFFSPVLNVKPDQSNSGRETKLEQLDWAWPISAMGGFDDCGLTWVPPPGSTVAILYQNGNPNTAFYIGTTWQRNKGPEDAANWGYPIPEYDKIFRGHRKGYMVGKNDESQHLPPWNTSNYQGFDFDSTVDTNLIPDAGTKTTWPHEYGLTSPEKHRIKLDDGDPKCNRRNKRIEIMSSMGAFFIMKDDPYHPCGDWVNPKCKISHVYIEPTVCSATDVTMISGISVWNTYPCQQGPENCSTSEEGATTTVEEEYLGLENICPPQYPMSTISATIPADCKGVLEGSPDICFSFNNEGKNKYHKHKQECFPFLENKCGLPQSGIQLLARSGHAFTMDDSVEEPRGRPEWERALSPFDKDGCTGVFKGRTWWRASTGHFIEMSDEEVQPKIRGPKNGITIRTASGNEVVLNDHSKPNCVAGESRGIRIKSTSEHALIMSDDTNQQCSPERDGCGRTGAYAKNAFVELRSGYGHRLVFADYYDQQKTDQQYIQLLSPQTDNVIRGPHMLHMQERPTGPGQVFLRAGGDLILYSYDKMVEVVGNKDDNPADKLEFVSNMKIVSVSDVYYNKAKTHCFWADDYIFLLAGKDSAVYPVVVAHRPIPEYISQMTGMKASEHIFASAIREPDDPCEGVASE